MKTNRCILFSTGYGGAPMEAHERKEILRIHLFKKRFCCGGQDYSIKAIKYYSNGVFKIEYFGKDTDFCFKPKWYQYPKIVLYYTIGFVSKNVLSKILKAISWIMHLVF